MTDLQFIKLLKMVLFIAEGCKDREEIIQKLKELIQKEKDDD